MDMDKSPLNRAHQLERKAEKLNRQKKLDECIQCHLEAVELYTKCLQLGDNKNTLESIQLQKEWNERQIRMFQLKKSYLERTEKEKKLNGITNSKYFRKEAVENLEAKIFRNFETHDSLICYLQQKGIIGNPEKYCHSTIEEEEEVPSPIIVGNKHPKDDSVVIEELKELSGQLRDSVQGWLAQLNQRKLQTDHLIEYINRLDIDKSFQEGLLIQLDDRNREIEQLKAHIKDLEQEKSYKEGMSKDFLQTTTSSSEGTSSPVSSLADLDIADLRSLPHLETMTIPELDISTFKQFRLPEVSCKLMRKDE